ncbi:thymidine kinase [Dethiosulfatibacter aminovorans DSM 17477]|uniref:Thymidine kinase n=1 Tax=Dethiosulfatibacter aminovorans DSM 17477 TaxID=1121476 RepID=A0A1M6HJ64_9FIRM|nr:thymidine kinase [Dethiosulfatibacter aminovorans]SHJ22230.1 thymidine kinase [Dethiosulfatibacter aminovorans DSM 17477]
MSKLYFRYGAMNCGKSTNLMQVAFNYEERGMETIIIKPGIDTKGDDKVVSRLGIERKVDIVVREDMNLVDEVLGYMLNCGELHCILADEVQFLKKEQIDQLFEIAVKMNIPVICYGLRTDFLMNGFEGSERLLLIAHSIEELKTICACGRKAILNGRKINGEFVFEGSQVAIDQENNVEYESLCGQCFFREKEKYLNNK